MLISNFGQIPTTLLNFVIPDYIVKAEPPQYDYPSYINYTS